MTSSQPFNLYVFLINDVIICTNDFVAIVQFVCVVYPMMSSFSQQDCQEFLAMLLDTLHEDYVLQLNDRGTTGRRALESSESHERPMATGDTSAENGSVITQNFRGMLNNEASSVHPTVVTINSKLFLFL